MIATLSEGRQFRLHRPKPIRSGLSGSRCDSNWRLPTPPRCQRGEVGDDAGPPKLIEAGKNFPFIVVSPQCPQGRWWEPVELAALLDEIVEKYKVDQDRIYVTGLSMGGFGTWSLAAYQPALSPPSCRFVVAVTPLTMRLFAYHPVWVFHGAKDPVVPLERSEKMVEALKKSGGIVKFTVYPEARQTPGPRPMPIPQLYKWLLQRSEVRRASRRSDHPIRGPFPPRRTGVHDSDVGSKATWYGQGITNHDGVDTALRKPILRLPAANLRIVSWEN